MLNQDKYKTAKERVKAFNEWCFNMECKKCKLKANNFDEGDGCRFYWLDLEAEEEKPEPCPFCDRPECATTKSAQDVWRKENGCKTAYYEWLLAASTKGEAK